MTPRKSVSRVVVLQGTSVDLAVRVPADHDLDPIEVQAAVQNKVVSFVAFRLNHGDEQYWRDQTGAKTSKCNWLSSDIKFPPYQMSGLVDVRELLKHFMQGDLTATLAELAGIKPSAVMPTTYTASGIEYPIEEKDGKYWISLVKRCTNNPLHIIKGISRIFMKDNAISSVQGFSPEDKDAKPEKKGGRGWVCGHCVREAAKLVEIENTRIIKESKPTILIRNLAGRTNNEKFDLYEARCTKLETYASELEAKVERTYHAKDVLELTIEHLNSQITELKAQLDESVNLNLIAADITSKSWDMTAAQLIAKVEERFMDMTNDPANYSHYDIGLLFRSIQEMKQMVK